MNMKTLTYFLCHSFSLLFFLFLMTVTVKAQDEEEEEKPKFMDMNRYNFYEIQRKAEKYFSKEEKREAKKKHQIKKEKEDSAFFSRTPNIDGRPEDNAYHKYKRWEWYWRYRINEDGSFHDVTGHGQEYLNLQKQNEGKIKTGNLKTAAGPTWVNINQTVADGGYNGMGRAVAVAFHPTDANTYYVGAPIGGVWKTTNGGTAYAPLTDALPYVSAGSIVVNYKKPAIMYISVGSSEGWWNWSLGIYKSYDGGLNWSTTGLNWTFTNYRAIKKIVMSPTDTSILYAATTDGLYRTLNSGATWTQLRTGYHTDVIFKITEGIASDGNVIFTGTDAGDIFRSTDAGATWTSIYTSGGNGVHLSVTMADPNTIAASLYGPSIIVYSRNLGTSFTTASGGLAQNPDIFFVSQTNSNIFYYGGVDVFKTTDAGTNWSQITHWCCPSAGQTTVHADNHYVGASPLNPGIIYFGNDGGVYKYNESTLAWTERTAGLITTQYYRIANAQNNNVVITGGTQDNGGRYRQPSGVWRASNGGDAMEQAIDPTNYNIMYSTYVNGQLYRTTNAWGGFTEITPGFSSGTREVGDWVTPYVLDPNNSQIIVAGYKEVWRSTDRGTTWAQISTNLTGGQNINQVAVTPGNSSIIYASQGTRMWKTINGGGTWTALTIPNAATTTDPWGSGAITSIAISNTNANNIWITRSGYNATVKVFKSTDQGATWTNLSAGLPNVPVNCMIYENNTNDGIYIGTDAGVFYRNASLPSWQYFGQGMPNTAVTDLEIQYASSKIRAGTHGRGVWETEVVGLPVSLISFTAMANQDYQSVLVKWSTASEKNNDYFLVERSENGIDFATVGKIKGKGNSLIVNEYSFTDIAPLKGKNYYRLTQVDLDGSRENSQVVVVNLSQEFEVIIQPNLFNDFTEIQINTSAESADVEITDVKGRSVFHSALATNKNIQLGYGLAKGIYFVKISTPEGRSTTQKVIKE
jgi:photosystem II stability/assembly factor-like uncharacterized protein